MNLQNKKRLTDLTEPTFGCGKMVGRVGKETVRESGMDSTHCCVQNGKPTRTCREHSAQHYVVAWIGGGWGEKGTWTCTAESLLCAPGTITTCSSTISQYKRKRL